MEWTGITVKRYNQRLWYSKGISPDGIVVYEIRSRKLLKKETQINYAPDVNVLILREGSDYVCIQTSITLSDITLAEFVAFCVVGQEKFGEFHLKNLEIGVKIAND